MPNQEFDKIIFLGCTVQSISVNATSDTTEGSFNFVLLEEPNQEFQFKNLNPIVFLGSGINFQLGKLNLNGDIVAVDKVNTDINGTGIYNIRIEEDGLDVADFQSKNILSFGDILSEHSDTILSHKSGSELIRNDRFLGDGLTILEGNDDFSINSTINLEVAGLPVTDIAKLLTPSLNTISTSIFGVVEDDFDSLTQLQEQSIISFFARLYPRRTKGIRQIQIQYSPNGGVRTRYSFSRYISYFDDLLRQQIESFSAYRKAEFNRITRDRFYVELLNELGLVTERPGRDIEAVNLLMDDVIEELGRLATQRLQYDLIKPEGGLGVIVGGSGGGPFYRVRRVNNVDIDPQTFSRFGPGMFTIEWDRVRNLSEPIDSPGYLLPGTQVTVSIFKEQDNSLGIPYIEQSPQVFAPPLPET